ncbi:hypothetical protein D083_2596 [Dickeya solani RNS 08.23.3.1.A]|nr:hypothetical protein D083_2596 [Dickeya solani RNS 08.23.3.1.A]
MPLALPLRNDDVERGTQRLALGEAEQAFGCGIPGSDETVGITNNHGISYCGKELL